MNGRYILTLSLPFSLQISSLFCSIFVKPPSYYKYKKRKVYKERNSPWISLTQNSCFFILSISKLQDFGLSLLMMNKCQKCECEFKTVQALRNHEKMCGNEPCIAQIPIVATKHPERAICNDTSSLVATNEPALKWTETKRPKKETQKPNCWTLALWKTWSILP